MTKSRPAVAPPPSEEADALGFWDDEAATYASILNKPYSALDDSDCIWLAGEAEVFLPVDHIRYFAPALVEHARSLLDDSYYSSRVLAALLKALPLPDTAELALQVRDLACMFPPRRFSMPLRGTDWRSGTAMGLVPGRFLRLALELDVQAFDLRSAPTTGPGAMALVELAFGLFEEQWDYPAVGPSPTSIVEAVERIARGSDRHAALGARFVLGEIGPEELPRCSDPRCPAHPDR